MTECQSCKQLAAEIVEPCDNENYPYHLCKGCHQHLINTALRPLEYFNLTAAHGMTYLLSDDFYDNDGEAGQPRIDIMLDKELAFPELEKIENNLESLIDYAIVQWWINDEVVERLKKFEKSDVLVSLRRRINENRALSYRLYDLAARVLETYAEEWIREEWKHHNIDTLGNYWECLAACLPLSEGFQYYVEVLDKINSPSILSQNLLGLIQFRSQLSLDWIEKNISRIKNISDAWGYLAVASKFDWPTAKKWLNAGRPLSLVALDALINCTVTTETLNSTVWLRENPQKLLNPDPIIEMNKALNNYLTIDNVPRVRSCVEVIQRNWDKILKD